MRNHWMKLAAQSVSEIAGLSGNSTKFTSSNIPLVSALSSVHRAYQCPQTVDKGASLGYARTFQSHARLTRNASTPTTRDPASPCSTSFALSRSQRRSMFIQTQNTPNDNSLMFLPGKSVMEGGGTHDFPNARSSLVSPLAKRLFGVDGVDHVFFGSDFVTVTKTDDADWGTLKPAVFAAIMDHYNSGKPLFEDDAIRAHSDTAITEDDDEVVAMIKELLETRIRPAVQEDGGDIVYRGFEQDTGVVFLQLVGACRGCASSSVTLKSGIENMLMHYIPEVKEVREWEDEGVAEAKKAFNDLEKHLSN